MRFHTVNRNVKANSHYRPHGTTIGSAIPAEMLDELSRSLPKKKRVKRK